MDDLLQYFSTHPLAVMALLLAVFLVVYFLFKQFIKMVLAIVIILLAMGGYFYFQEPGRVWERMKETLQKARTKTGKMVQTGKGVYHGGKNLYEKGKKLSGDIKKALDKDEEKSGEK